MKIQDIYINNYIHCGIVWMDTADSKSNDECPECGKEIEPSHSTKLNLI